MTEEQLISADELKSYKEIDNMSLSDIIRERFKDKAAVHEVQTPQEVAEVIIKPIDEVNLQKNVEGEETV